MALVINEKDVPSVIRSTLVDQLDGYHVSFPEHAITAMAEGIAEAVAGCEVDETHVIDTIDTRSLLSRRERHHDRCMSPFDDGHLTCPVVGGRHG